MLVIEGWVPHKLLQAPCRVSQLLLERLQDGVVDQGAHFQVMAPSLVRKLHLELHMLVKIHE